MYPYSITAADVSISMVTVSAAAAKASVGIDTVGVRTTSAVVRGTFVSICTVHSRQHVSVVTLLCARPRGHFGIALSARPSIRPSVCPIAQLPRL